MSHEDFVRTRLFEQRTVFLRGTLDEKTAGDAAAELMTLDATGDSGITLMLDAAGTTLTSAFTVMDVIDLLGVPVRAVCMGRAEGAAVGIQAVCQHRSAGPNARFRLRDPDIQTAGTASQLTQAVEHHAEQLRRFHQRIAQAVNQPVEVVATDFADGRYLDANEAKRYGLVDEIVGRPPLAVWRPSDESRSQHPDA